MNTKNSLIADEITDFMITVGSKYLHNLDHNIFEITQEYVRGVNTILVKYPPYTDDEEIKQMTNVVIKVK